MEKHVLIMAWTYDYVKEGTWDDTLKGKTEYELIEGASYLLPNFFRKRFEIRSVTVDGDRVTAEIYADSHTYTVCSDGEPVVGHVHNSYSVAGDSVSETLCMKLSIK